MFKKLFTQFSDSFNAPLAPESPVFVIGDLHGCSRQLYHLLYAMDAKDPAAYKVFVGDFIDRGDNSKSVLNTLWRMQQNPRVVCLRGNHEDMMLQFLSRPSSKTSRWLRHGGLNTMGSYALNAIPHNSAEPVLKEAAQGLKKTMGAPMLSWLKSLPVWWQSGNLVVTHAGADPTLPMNMQADSSFLWGHRDFLNNTRSDGIWVAHGHTVVDEPSIASGRIAVDTGAYATGRLTAAYTTSGKVEFLHAT